MAANPTPFPSHVMRLVLVALAAFFAVRVGAPPATSPAPPGAAERTGSPAAPPKESEGEDIAYLTPLCNLLRVELKDLSRDDLLSEVRGEIENAPKQTDVPRELLYKTEYLIVTVPDPQLAGTDYLTDALLESIRRAIETPHPLSVSPARPLGRGETPRRLRDSPESPLGRGPVLDRYWLPWRSKRTPNFATFGPGQPGMLLFRERRDSGFICVLVVGEHPGMGLDRGAMAIALHTVDFLQDTDKPIRILGPTFTGSQDSLASALSRFEYDRYHPEGTPPPTPRNYNIFNGSATALRVDDLLDDARPAEITYESTVIPDRDLQDCLLHYLAGDPASSGLAKLRRLAFLVESDTGYGQQIALGLKRFNESMQVMVIPFPLNVSRVLAAYQAQRLKASDKLPRLQSSELQVAVPLQTEDMAFRRMQPYEPGLAAVRVDLLLREITRSIREQKIRYVGVIATNSLDKLFLASLVRQACPDVRLFATTGELTMTHADVSGDLTGMVVASTYPLFRSNQAWAGPNFANLQAAFGHQSELGVYNAVQLLLGHPERLMEYCAPFDRGAGGEPDRPPVWISVVGRDAIYPLQTCKLKEPEFDLIIEGERVNDVADGQVAESRSVQKQVSKVYPRPANWAPAATVSDFSADQRDPGAPLPALIILAASCAATLGVTNWMTRRRPVPTVRVTAFSALATACLVAFWLSAVWLLRGADWALSYTGVAKCASWLALLASAAALGAVAADGIAAARESTPQMRRLRIAAAGAGVILVWASAVWASSWRADCAMFDLARTINLKGGVSPLAPLALWTFAAVTLSLAHALLVVEFAPSNRLAIVKLPLHDDLTEASSKMDDLELVIAQPWRPRGEDRKVVRWAPVALLVVLLGLPASWDLSTRSSLDIPWHGWLCAALYLTTLALLCWHLWWLAGLATRFRHTLLRFAALPCANAFGELPRFFGDDVSGGLFRWISTSLHRMMEILEDQVAAIHRQVRGANRKLPTHERWSRLHDDFCQEVERLANEVWPKRFVEMETNEPEDAKAEKVEAAKNARSQASPDDQAEIFVAGMLFTYLMPFLIQMRRLSRALMYAAVAFVLATWSYPFIPQTSLQLSAWAIVLLVAHRLWRVASQLNSDELMSRATGTKPHEVTWNTEFAGVVVTYIGPVVALLLYSFFGLPEGVVQWLGGLTGR